MLETTYPNRVTQKMKALFNSLSEKHRRLYAAIEADKLGHGGIKYISELLGIDPKTINRGLADLDDDAVLAAPRHRKAGGGRKKDRSNSWSKRYVL